MRIPVLLATLMLAGLLTASAQDTGSQAAPAASSGTSTLTGCLKGSKGQYFIVEQNGTRHTLQAKGQDLSSYVNHQVTVTGKADTSRNAGASADAYLARCAIVRAERAVADFTAEIAGEDGLLGGSLEDGEFRTAMIAGLGGGSYEVQLNLIARLWLQLPKSGRSGLARGR